MLELVSFQVSWVSCPEFYLRSLWGISLLCDWAGNSVTQHVCPCIDGLLSSMFWRRGQADDSSWDRQVWVQVSTAIAFDSKHAWPFFHDHKMDRCRAPRMQLKHLCIHVLTYSYSLLHTRNLEMFTIELRLRLLLRPMRWSKSNLISSNVFRKTSCSIAW